MNRASSSSIRPSFPSRAPVYLESAPGAVFVVTQRFPIRERKVVTPSQLNLLARSVLEDALAIVWVAGEISNFTRASSGHWYFTLKDATAQIRCAMFRNNNQYVRAQARDGLNVVLRGRVTLYETRGEYQLVADHLEEDGAGLAHQAFEALKARLAAEGLTDLARKKALPAMPLSLALITSPRGAAIGDVLSVFRRRWPMLSVDVFPCQVQGIEAPEQLTDAMRRACGGRYDVILLTRGGGATEDLAAFNNESLARAIAAAPIPVVSAVGHEIDVTIADFVADLRAPTPSAAAEIIAPDGEAIARRLRDARSAIERRMQRVLESRTQRLDQLSRLVRAHQRDGAHQRQSLQFLLGRLEMVGVATARERTQKLHQRLLRLSPDRHLGNVRMRAGQLYSRLAFSASVLSANHQAQNDRLAMRLIATRSRMVQLRQRTHLAQRALHLLGPQATLERGFVLLARADGTLLTRAAHTAAGDVVTARFADGERQIQIRD